MLLCPGQGLQRVTQVRHHDEEGQRQPDDKIVKIITEEYEIEMKPKNEEEFIVKVDGKNIKESEYEQYK